MGSGRDKKKKLKPNAPGQGAQKTERKTQKAEDKKLRRQERATDGDEDDIDAILAGIKLMDERKEAVTVKDNVPPPTARVNCTLTALTGPVSRGPKSGTWISRYHTRDTDLVLFGGEHFDGIKTRVYGDLFRYNCSKDQWASIESPNSPPPRSAHQAWTYRGFYYIFGGEFTSPNQERFHHYKDLWRLDLATNQWEQLNLKGAPSARSGHRMVVYKAKVVLFGGFYDTGKEVKYYNDLFELDLEDLTWQPVGRPEDGPSPRSACQLAVHEKTMFLYGGYSKRQADVIPGIGIEEKGTTFSDMWALDLDTYAWEKVKKAGMPPGPRAGFTFAVNKKQVVMFGGVVDHEKDRGEIIVSEFYNETYTFQMSSRRWFPLILKGPKGGGGKGNMEAPESTALLQTGAGAAAAAGGGAGEPTGVSAALHAAATKIQAHYRGHIVRKAVRLYRIGGIVSECLYSPGTGLKPPKNVPRPIGRINAAMTVFKNVLYLFGGMLEIGDTEITLDDMWSLDLGKLTVWTCHKELTTLPEDLKPVQSDSDEEREENGENKTA